MLKKLQRKTLVPTQIVGYAVTILVGITIVMLTFQLYSDMRPMLTNQTSVFKAHTVTLSKNVSVFKSMNKESMYFTDDELETLEKQEFVKNVARFASSSFEVSATVSLGGHRMSTDLFFESVPDDYIDVESDAWRWDSTTDFLPIIIPEDYLQLYNFGFAESQSLPVVSQATIEQVTFSIIVKGNGKQRMFTSRIVGFSDKINTILVPYDFLQWANREYGTASPASAKNGKASRLLVEFNDASDERIPSFITSHGLNVSKSELESSKLLFLFRTVLLTVFAIALLIILLSMAFIILSLSLVVQKNRDLFVNLYNIGYPTGRISRYYQIVVSVVTIMAIAVATVATTMVRHYYVDRLSSMFTIDGGMGVTVVTALVLCLMLPVVYSLFIRRTIVNTVVAKK